MSPSSESANLAVALNLASLDCPVLPCREEAAEGFRAKAPYGDLVPRGLLDATTDPEVIRRWWAVHPDALPAVRTGSIESGGSGFDAWDMDVKDGLPGRTWLSKVEAAGLVHAHRLRIGTPSGGVHVYVPACGEGNEQSVKGPDGHSTGLDYRGRGGYVIAPGARYPDGSSYTTAEGLETWIRDARGIAALPYKAGYRALAAGPGPQHAAGSGDLARFLDRLALSDITVSSRQAQGYLDGVEYRATCPVHGRDLLPDGSQHRTDSLSFGQLPSGRFVLRCHAGCPTKEITDAVGFSWGPASGRPTAFAQCVRTRSALADLHPVTALVEDIISMPAAVVLVGAYGSGKTFLMLTLACSVATQVPFLGRPVAERRNVLYVCGEGVSGIHARLHAWEQEVHAGQPVPDEALYVAEKPASLTDPTMWEEMTSFCLENAIGLVVLDTLSSLASDADETKQAPMIMRKLSDLASAIDGTAVLVHHPGWGDAKRTRGGYQLEGNADEVLLLEVDEGADGVTRLRRKKCKEGPAGGTVHFRLRRAGDSMVVEEQDAEDVHMQMRQRLLHLLDDAGPAGATGHELVNQLSTYGSRSNVYAQLQRLIKQDRVDKTGPARSPRYSLTEFNPGEDR